MSDGHNERFTANPVIYLNQVTIQNAMSMGGAKVSKGTLNTNLEHTVAYMDLVPVSGGKTATTVTATYHSAPGKIKSPIQCAFVPYWNEGDVNSGKLLPKVALPAGGNPKFVFTGAMNGCSLVIAQDLANQQYGIHYPNSGGAANGFPHVGRDGMQVVKSLNYVGGYGEANDALLAYPVVGTWSNVFAFFYYYNNAWCIVGQPQIGFPSGKLLMVQKSAKIPTLFI